MYGEIDPLLYHHVTNIFVKNASDQGGIIDAINFDIALDNFNIILEDITTIRFAIIKKFE